MLKHLLFLFLIVAMFSSCKVFYPNELFRVTDNYHYFQFAQKEEYEHIIMPGDNLTLTVYTKDGYQLIDVLGMGASGGGNIRSGGSNRAGVEYTVQEDGFVELPILGMVYVQGLTRMELKDKLEQMFSRLYQSPYVLLDITNRKVFVFTGVGEAKIVNLPYKRTTLIEVIAMAGGISSDNKSYNIKVLRGDYENPQIKVVDLSTLNGLKDAGMIIQANDIIIIEPVRNIIPRVLNEITPILTLFTTFITVYLLIVNNPFAKQ